MASLQDSLYKSMNTLRGMSASQRVAIFLGVILVAGSLAWMASWAAVPDMVPLLPQALSPEDATRVTAGLQAMGEEYRLSGSQVLVRSSASRDAILARLQQDEQLPTDTSLTFAAMVKASDPWASQAENNRRWTLALQTELARVLSQFQGVREARVFLNLNSEPRGFAREQRESSASVTLIMKGNEPAPAHLGKAAARLVAGAVQGLTPRRVEVVDAAGRPVVDWEAEDPEAAPGIHRLQREKEREVTQKIRNQLSFDPNLRVNVQVVLDPTAVHERNVTPSEPVVIEQSETETKTGRSRRDGQPGVEPNTGLSVSDNSGSEEMTTSSTSDKKSQVVTSTSEKATPAGNVVQVFAAVNLSRTYLVSVFQQSNPDAKEPTEEQLQAVFEKQKARIISQVEKLVMPPSGEQVAVDWYYDGLTVAAAESAPASAGVSMDMVARYGPAAGLSLLALFSLGLMLRMAKKGHDGEAFALELGLPKEAIDAARKAREDLAHYGSLPSDKSRSGQGGAGDSSGRGSPIVTPIPDAAGVEGLLVAKEVGEEAAAVTKMIEQVSSHVAHDAEGIAAMIEKWVDQPTR